MEWKRDRTEVRRVTINRRWAGAGFLALALLAGRAGAQELTPRAYSPNPTGGNIFILGYARSSGGACSTPRCPSTT
jgi:hypothetical protein